MLLDMASIVHLLKVGDYFPDEFLRVERVRAAVLAIH
jgi:hypothetical protein